MFNSIKTINKFKIFFSTESLCSHGSSKRQQMCISKKRGFFNENKNGNYFNNKYSLKIVYFPVISFDIFKLLGLNGPFPTINIAINLAHHFSMNRKKKQITFSILLTLV